jgi:hypothetical protein
LLTLAFKVRKNKRLFIPLEDELEDFSDFERGLTIIYFEHNCYVIRELAGEKIQLHQYHDVLNS